MDVLSDVLSKVRLNGALFLNGAFGAPWCVASPPRQMLADSLNSPKSNVIVYHLVMDGECLAAIDENETIAASAGEIVVFPFGDKHRIGSTIHGASVAMPASLTDPDLCLIEAGGSGASTRLICGWLTTDLNVLDPLQGALPPVFKVNIRQSSSGAWLESSIEHAVSLSTSNRDGINMTTQKLAELLFVETLRGYLEVVPTEARNWLSGLKDPQVGHALKLLHSDPKRSWTVEELAQEVHASRSVIADRFRRLVGMPPMRYLTKWRIAIAASLLREGQHSIGQIVEQVGYESESAFSRAFKRELGFSPSRWRA